MIAIIIFVILVVVPIIARPLAVTWRVNRELRLYRHNEEGYKYVYVEEDGSVRELERAEIEYLEALFHPVDGPRPYKYYYDQLNKDKTMAGYIERICIPRAVDIKPAGRPKKQTPINIP